MEIFVALVIPFLGTILGSLLVFCFRKQLNNKVEKLLLGFAAGVMIAASVWSLLIPSIELGEGKFAIVPASVGFVLGMLFLLLLDTLLPHLHVHSKEPEGIKSRFKKDTMMFLAMTIHNIPEGMAVGVILAGLISGNVLISFSGVLALSIGIALQNIPEGAVVSFDFKNNGDSNKKSFIFGALSGIGEPIGAALMILFSSIFTNLLPYFLSFAAGAMIYVVVEELIPESQNGKHSNIATIGVMLGFTLMMILDVVLG